MQKLTDAWHAANVYSMGEKTASFKGKVFYSYSTPIAFKHDGVIYINANRYSKTTTCQVLALKEYAQAHRFRVQEVTEEQIKELIKPYK